MESGRILVTDLEVGGSPLRVINMYGPTSVAEGVSLFTKLAPLLQCGRGGLPLHQTSTPATLHNARRRRGRFQLPTHFLEQGGIG